MLEGRAYLDHNASAPLTPAARAAMLAALEVDANPSSVHAEGRAARRLIEEARVAVYDLAERAVPGRDDLARVERDCNLRTNTAWP